jgi:hypothetical protein
LRRRAEFKIPPQAYVRSGCPPLELTTMKIITALAIIASLFALGSSDPAAEAKSVKFRIKDHHHDNWKLSCNTARHMVQEQGYYPVKAKSCGPTVYSFYATRKGRTYIFRVDSRTGFITRG